MDKTKEQAMLEAIKKVLDAEDVIDPEERQLISGYMQAGYMLALVEVDKRGSNEIIENLPRREGLDWS